MVLNYLEVEISVMRVYPFRFVLLKLGKFGTFWDCIVVVFLS